MHEVGSWPHLVFTCHELSFVKCSLTQYPKKQSDPRFRPHEIDHIVHRSLPQFATWAITLYPIQGRSNYRIVPVSLMSGVFPPSADNAGDGGEADLAIFEVAEAVNAEAEEDDPVDEADASRLLCALHAV